MFNTGNYGTCNASNLSTRSHKQLDIGKQKNYLLTSSVILKDFYVDGVLSETSLERAKNEGSQLIELSNLPNMKLQKWCANHQDLLASENRVTIEYSFNDQPECNYLKTLGVL